MAPKSIRKTLVGEPTRIGYIRITSKSPTGSLLLPTKYSFTLIALVRQRLCLIWRIKIMNIVEQPERKEGGERKFHLKLDFH